MIEVQDLSKRYRDRFAVDRLSFTVQPGRVTGFLGPNGAGKSTTMRLILGLDHASAGAALVNGVPYAHLRHPLRVVGSLLDARAVHSGRSGYAHLRYLAQSNGIPRSRVGVVLDEVGLTSSARVRTRAYSLGMAQRLGIAAALLGDPAVLILDEPVNGLDTDGIRWLRNLIRGWAADGRTVLLSSHLMGELELTADHLVIIRAGRLVADTSMKSFIETNSTVSTVVRPADPGLAAALRDRGATVLADGSRLVVTGVDAPAIGDCARDRGIGLRELSPRLESLEEVYTRTYHS